ncbi:ADP-ribose diphosphatase [Pasteurella bettyae]|uniref:ADP-ribose pyrophosphatase n=1 Tax=Pasteurella bettyae CCUG 2042 TaxID=1095749 RepID=I3D7S5_9PAST|nr:ADP-ribose diphosphatase [Pasteurella bettyae]EIJ67768.1 ADP-ribose pyrophosphatase [Pasteurella bettyae CCUG 2042]SUB22151.1 ADP-ribose pyrophosphatase [Pasteurella bettyae]
MSDIQKFTQQDIEIVKEESLYEGFFRLQRIQFRHKLFAGGMSNIVTRELLYKGAASAVIAYDAERDSVVLVEQVRIGAYQPGLSSSPWLLELIAGMIEPGESPEQVALRESEEEAGIKISHLEHVLSVWDSPGSTVERLYLFVGKVDSRTATGLHGLANEHEDIKVHVVDRETAYQWINEGKIDNSIALMGIQWLQLNYQKLQEKWC